MDLSDVAIIQPTVPSAPAMVDYSVPTPKKPEYIQAKSVIGGLSVSVPAIPSSCKGVNVYINGNAVFYPNNAVFIPLEADVYTVKCAYVDIFGEGEQTAEEVVSVKAVIDAETIKSIGITRDMLDSSLDEVLQDAQGASLKIDEANNRITSIVTALKGNPKDSGYSAITQLYNGLQLKVSKDNIISSINLSKEGVQINGKMLHVTGQTVFDDNVITRKMIQAKAVTADKISVDNLGAISANIGTVRGGTIIGTTIQNDSGSFKVDRNGNIQGARIDGQSFKLSGFDIMAMTKGVYDVAHGADCPLPAGYSESECVFIPSGGFGWSKATKQNRYGGLFTLVNGQTIRIDDVKNLSSRFTASSIASENTLSLVVLDQYSNSRTVTTHVGEFIGLNGRRVCCIKYYPTSSNESYEMESGYTKVYVIGMKR